MYIGIKIDGIYVMIQVHNDKINIENYNHAPRAVYSDTNIYILYAAYLCCSTVMRMIKHRDEPKEIDLIAFISALKSVVHSYNIILLSR